MRKIKMPDPVGHDQPGEYRRKPRVLVVDDEPEVAAALRDLIEYEGFRVETAENGRQALHYLKRGRRFDLIITDMNMPEMDGLELIRRVRQLKRNLPVIVLTGYATFKSGLEAIREGVYDYVSKPFSVNLLMNVVHEALRDKRRSRRNTVKGDKPR